VFSAAELREAASTCLTPDEACLGHNAQTGYLLTARLVIGPATRGKRRR